MHLKGTEKGFKLQVLTRKCSKKRVYSHDEICLKFSEAENKAHITSNLFYKR